MSALPLNNQSAILSGGYSPWQAPLAALFSGISAAAQPGGFANFGQGVQQGQQNFQQGQQQQQAMDLRRMQIEQAQEEARRANQEREQEQARLESIKQSLARFSGSPTPSAVRPVGNYGAATGGIQTASGAPDGGQLAAMFGGDPQKAALFSQYAEVDPEGAFQMLVERGFAEPEKYDAASPLGKLKADLQAGLIDQPTYDALVKKETAPPEGPAPTERYRNAIAAGLKPGTPEFQQYMLGKDDTPQGLFQGTGMDQQAMNIVLRGQSDPTYRNTPEYAAAWNQLYEQPKIITTPDPNDPTRLVQMQIMMPKPQGFQGPGGTAPTPAPNQNNPLAPLPAPQSSTATVIPGTSVVPQKEAADLRKFESEADAMLSALDTFEATVTNAGTADFADSFAGGYTEGGRKLSTDWANAALLSKAESLYNLGVLNGPDLDIIRNTLTDPSTFKGQFTGKDAYKTSIASIRKLIKDRVNTKRSGMNMAPKGEDYQSMYGLTPTN